MIRAHGESKRYEHAVLGYNFRMTDIAAAIGIVQLKKIEKFNEKRIANANYLTKELKSIEGIITPKQLNNTKHVYHQYTIKVTRGNRDEWVKLLNEHEIGTGIHYPIPIYKQELYIELGYDDNLENTEEAAANVISLPVHPSVTEKDLKNIVNVLKEISDNFSKY
jgi:dTDP-4-amino-4,6-dideoxygalactose transaminase